MDVVENRIEHKPSEPAQTAAAKTGRLVPEGTFSYNLGATEWTLILIEGPKKIDEILDIFKVGDRVNITKIKIDQKVIYEDKISRTGKTLPTNILVE